MALVPFELSSSDLEKAVIEGQTVPLLADLPTTLNANFTPASTWGTDQLRALNVKVLLDVEDHRVIPSEYIPNDDDKGIWILSFDHIED
jgi:hypothetical protein